MSVIVLVAPSSSIINMLQFHILLFSLLHKIIGVSNGLMNLDIIIIAIP